MLGLDPGLACAAEGLVTSRGGHKTWSVAYVRHFKKCEYKYVREMLEDRKMKLKKYKTMQVKKTNNRVYKSAILNNDTWPFDIHMNKLCKLLTKRLNLISSQTKNWWFKFWIKPDARTFEFPAPDRKPWVKDLHFQRPKWENRNFYQNQN